MVISPVQTSYMSPASSLTSTELETLPLRTTITNSLPSLSEDTVSNRISLEGLTVICADRSFTCSSTVESLSVITESPALTLLPTARTSAVPSPRRTLTFPSMPATDISSFPSFAADTEVVAEGDGLSVVSLHPAANISSAAASNMAIARFIISLSFQYMPAAATAGEHE